MDKLYTLKEMLCEELEEYGKKDKLDMGGLEIVDKLAHAVKNLDRIIETYEDEEGASMAGSYDGYMDGSYARGGQDGNQGQRMPRRGNSYARGRNVRRDSMGRYSRRGSYDGYSRHADEMVEELRGLMEEAPDEKTRKEFERFIEKIEQM